MSTLIHNLEIENYYETTTKRQRLNYNSQYKHITYQLTYSNIKKMSSSSPSNTTSVSSTAMNSPIFSGLYTPLTQSNSINNQHDLNNNNIYHEKIKMIDESHFENHNTNSKQQLMNSFSNDCPCGHLHGAGQGHHDDLGAIGLADFPLLRGPD